MGVIVAVEGVCEFQGADDFVVDEPLQALFCPVESVVVEFVLDVVDIVVDCAVVGAVVAFAEVVCFD